MGMTDRVAVFHEGRISGIVNTRESSQEEIMHLASGRQAAMH
jgi:ribose transport system ATP-binding protein